MKQKKKKVKKKKCVRLGLEPLTPTAKSSPLTTTLSIESLCAFVHVTTLIFDKLSLPEEFLLCDILQ